MRICLANVSIDLLFLYTIATVATIGGFKEMRLISSRWNGDGAVSLLGVGGASAINASRIKSAEIMAYGDLGTESIKKLYFDRFRVIVGIDTEGNVLQNQEIPKYKR